MHKLRPLAVQSTNFKHTVWWSGVHSLHCMRLSRDDTAQCLPRRRFNGFLHFNSLPFSCGNSRCCSRSRITACPFPFPWDSHEKWETEIPILDADFCIVFHLVISQAQYRVVLLYVFEGLRIRPKPDTPAVACTLMAMTIVCCMSNFSRIQWFRRENNDWHKFEENYDYNRYTYLTVYNLIHCSCIDCIDLGAAALIKICAKWW